MQARHAMCSLEAHASSYGNVSSPTRRQRGGAFVNHAATTALLPVFSAGAVFRRQKVSQGCAETFLLTHCCLLCHPPAQSRRASQTLQRNAQTTWVHHTLTLRWQATTVSPPRVSALAVFSARLCADWLCWRDLSSLAVDACGALCGSRPVDLVRAQNGTWRGHSVRPVLRRRCTPSRAAAVQCSDRTSEKPQKRKNAKTQNGPTTQVSHDKSFDKFTAR